MSGLVDLLARRTPAGTYAWHSHLEVPDVRREVEDAGWVFAHVDGRVARTKPDLLRVVGTALDFPDWYGQNFDALADCLSDVDRGDGTLLLWDDWDVLAGAEPRAFSVALSVLGTRVNDERGGPFAVLLRGDGPALPGVPTLA